MAISWVLAIGPSLDAVKRLFLTGRKTSHASTAATTTAMCSTVGLPHWPAASLHLAFPLPLPIGCPGRGSALPTPIGQRGVRRGLGRVKSAASVVRAPGIFDGRTGAGGGLLAGARGDARLHHGLRPDHRRSAAGTPQPLPALLQPAPGVPEVPGLEAHHDIPLLRAPGIRLLLQHALRVPLLPHAGGGFLPRSQGRLRLHVSLWWCSYDSAGIPGQPLFPGTGPHGHAGLCMEPAQPSGEGQLLRLTQLPGAIPALGPHGLLHAAGQLRPHRPARDCCGPHLLLPRRCLSQPAWRQETAADPRLPETTTRRPSRGPQLPAPSRRATRALTAAPGAVNTLGSVRLLAGIYLLQPSNPSTLGPPTGLGAQPATPYTPVSPISLLNL